MCEADLKDKATGSWHCIQSPRNQESARIEGTYLAEQTLVLSLTLHMDPMLHWAWPYTLKQLAWGFIANIFQQQERGSVEKGPQKYA